MGEGRSLGNVFLENNAEKLSLWSINVTDMKERLAQFLKKEGLTAVKFAEIMEVQPSSISHLLSGRNKPNFEFISRMLLRFPDLNPDWLINGRGGVYRSNLCESQDLITDVNTPSVTVVNEPEPKQQMMDIPDVNASENSNNKHFEFSEGAPELGVTNVNAARAISPVETATKLNESSGKEISRVILFFSDGSFEEYCK